MIRVRETSFGSLEVLSKQPLVERMTFNSEGKPHTHDGTEYCYVLEGSGKIVGANPEDVQEGDLSYVPPGTEHWMIPDKKPFKILIFYK